MVAVEHVAENATAGQSELVVLTLRNGGTLVVAVSNEKDADKTHVLTHGERDWRWQGFVDVLYEGES